MPKMCKFLLVGLFLFMTSGVLTLATTDVDGTGGAPAGGIPIPEKVAPNQPVRPVNFKPFDYPSARELMEKHSDDMMKRADKLMEKVEKSQCRRQVQIKLGIAGYPSASGMV